MQIGIVVGSVWSTRKLESLVGMKLMIVKPVNILNEESELTPVIAVDNVGAGVGETVLVVGGSSARAVVNDSRAPVDAAIVGIVDDRELDPRWVIKAQ